jgi:hypothetical protein
LLFVLVGVGGDVVAEHAVAEIGLPSEPQADLVPFLEAESVIELDGGSFLFVVPADGRVLDLVDGVRLERGRVKGERVDGERRVDIEGEGVERLGEDFEAGRRQKTREGIGEGEERCELKGREGPDSRVRQTAKRTSEGELERDEQDRAWTLKGLGLKISLDGEIVVDLPRQPDTRRTLSAWHSLSSKKGENEGQAHRDDVGRKPVVGVSGRHVGKWRGGVESVDSYGRE